MGRGALLVKTLENLPWRILAVFALERAPELFRKAGLPALVLKQP